MGKSPQVLAVSLTSIQRVIKNLQQHRRLDNYDEQIHDTSGFMISDIEGETGHVESRSTELIVD